MATLVFVATKFTEGAWVVIIAIPALMLLFARIQNYYRVVGEELAIGQIPDKPCTAPGLVIVPVDRLEHLVGFFEHEGLERIDGLLAIPRAAVGSEQAVHDLDEPAERRAWCHGDGLWRFHVCAIPPLLA